MVKYDTSTKNLSQKTEIVETQVVSKTAPFLRLQLLAPERFRLTVNLV
jgi:hypothetical protein